MTQFWANHTISRLLIFHIVVRMRPFLGGMRLFWDTSWLDQMP